MKFQKDKNHIQKASVVSNNRNQRIIMTTIQISKV